MSKKSRENRAKAEALKQRKGSGVNVRSLLEKSIKTAKGGNALAFAINEVINNAIDAGATEIQVRLGNHIKKPALIVMDNSRGFTEKGVDSILGHGYSAQDRDDNTTMGANGTGSKTMLGLGEIYNTQTTIFSFSDDYPKGLEIVYDLEYLVAEAEKRESNTGYIIEACTYEDFHYGKIWQRKPGTTFILTGYDGRTVNMKTLIIALSNCLTPKTQHMVKLFDIDGKEQKFDLVKIEGKKYSFEETFPKLGKITMDLYYGGPNQGPKICGKVNYITDYSAMFKNLLPEHKERISRVWYSIGGFTYIENLNTYRLDDGSFNEKFHKTGAEEELTSMLEIVGSELSEMDEKVNEEKTKEQRKKMLMRMVEASQKLNPQSFHRGTGLGRTSGPSSQEEIYIVPKHLTIEKGRAEDVTLANKGIKYISMDKARWMTNPFVDIAGSGVQVKITGKKLGKGSILVNGDNWTHEIELDIVEPRMNPVISGPKFVKPGESADYEIHRFEGNVQWEISDADSSIKLLSTTGQKTSIKVNEETKIKYFSLKCLDEKNRILHSRRLIISDSTGSRAPIVNIGGKNYLLEFGTHYQNCLTQIEDDDADYPRIVINPLHAIARGKGWYTEMKEVIHAVCYAALAYQIENDGLSTQKALSLVWKSIEDYHKIIFGKQKDDSKS